MRTLSQNPESVRFRERYSSDPEFREKQLRLLRERRARLKGTPEFRKQKARHDLAYRLKVRESEEFRKKRNVYNTRHWEDPVMAERLRQSIRKWRENNKKKVAAHNVLNAALKSGKIIRPSSCNRCGKNPGLGRDGRSLLQAHHEDHSKPLQVEWLCASCHAVERRKY